MKILHITPYYKPAWVYGGPVQSISALAEAQAVEHEVSVYTTTANGHTTLAEYVHPPQLIHGTQVYYFEKLPIPGFLAPGLLRHLWRNMRQFDVVHIHTWWTFTTILSVLICRLQSVTPIFSPRGMLSAYSFSSGLSFGKKLFQGLLGQRLLNNTVLHATSTLEWEECRLMIPEWQHVVLPNILHLPKIDVDKAGPSTDGPVRLIFISRIHPKKGLGYLFEALAKIQVNWSLQIVGAGEEAYINELKAQAEKSGIGTRIQWMGWVAGEERFHILATADLMVLTSENENFANVVVESLSTGTAVFISSGVGLCDFVEEHRLGWVTNLDPETIAEDLQRTLLDSAQLNWIRANAPGIIAEKFAPTYLSDEYIRKYQQII